MEGAVAKLVLELQPRGGAQLLDVRTEDVVRTSSKAPNERTKKQNRQTNKQTATLELHIQARSKRPLRDADVVGFVADWLFTIWATCGHAVFTAVAHHGPQVTPLWRALQRAAGGAPFDAHVTVHADVLRLAVEAPENTQNEPSNKTHSGFQ